LGADRLDGDNEGLVLASTPFGEGDRSHRSHRSDSLKSLRWLARLVPKGVIIEGN